MHDAFATEMCAENFRQFRHENFSHLQGADDNAKIVRSHHPSDVRRYQLIFEDIAQQVSVGEVHHAQKSAETLVADRRSG